MLSNGNLVYFLFYQITRVPALKKYQLVASRDGFFKPKKTSLVAISGIFELTI